MLLYDAVNNVSTSKVRHDTIVFFHSETTSKSQLTTKKASNMLN